MVPAGALQPAHGRASALFGDTPPDDRHLAEDARLDPAAARTGRPAFAHGLPRSTAARRIRPHAPRRIAHAPSRLAHRLGAGKFRRDRQRPQLPASNRTGSIYHAPETAKQQVSDHRGPRNSARPIVRPLRCHGNRFLQSSRTDFRSSPDKHTRQMHPANAPGGAMSAPNRKKVPFGTFSILPFRKHKPHAVPCRSRDKSP